MCRMHWNYTLTLMHRVLHEQSKSKYQMDVQSRIAPHFFTFCFQRAGLFVIFEVFLSSSSPVFLGVFQCFSKELWAENMISAWCGVCPWKNGKGWSMPDYTKTGPKINSNTDVLVKSTTEWIIQILNSWYVKGKEQCITVICKTQWRLFHSLELHLTSGVANLVWTSK